MKDALKILGLLLLVCGLFSLSIHCKIGRGDEFFSMFNTVGVSWSDYIAANFQGASHSLVHASLLKLFSIDGIFEARVLSSFIFVFGLIAWFFAFKRAGVSVYGVSLGLFFFSISGSGVFLATDGQFHDLVFAFSGLFYLVFLSGINDFLKFSVLSLLSVSGFFFGADWMLLLPLLGIVELQDIQNRSLKRWLLLGCVGVISLASFSCFRSELLLPNWNDVIVTKTDRNFFDGLVIHLKGVVFTVPITVLILGIVVLALKKSVENTTLKKLLIAYISLRFLFVLAGLISGVDNQLPSRYFAAVDVFLAIYLGELLVNWFEEIKHRTVVFPLFIGLIVVFQAVNIYKNGRLDLDFHKGVFSELSDRDISSWVERNRVYRYNDSLVVLNDGSRRCRYFHLWHRIHPSAPLKFLSPIEFESKFKVNLVLP